jgi:hypothetical protein
MKENVRAAVAAIALSHSLGRKISAVYDYTSSGYRNVEMSVSHGHVQGYDYDASCHIDGNIPNLYHYGESSHLDFNSNGSGKYEGYDYGSSCHFEVTVKGSSADVYDYGASGYFSYSL